MTFEKDSPFLLAPASLSLTSESTAMVLVLIWGDFSTDPCEVKPRSPGPRRTPAPGARSRASANAQAGRHPQRQNDVPGTTSFVDTPVMAG